MATADNTAPLTVLQLLPALEGGGVERGTLEIADALITAGHESHVASAYSIARPAVSEKRLARLDDGRIRYELKTPYRDG